MTGGINGQRRRPHSTTVPEPWETITARPAPRDVIAEHIRAEVQRYRWQTLVVAAVILVMQVGLAVLT